jgi:hypothetical protein
LETEVVEPHIFEAEEGEQHGRLGGRCKGSNKVNDREVNGAAVATVEL